MVDIISTCVVSIGKITLQFIEKIFSWHIKNNSDYMNKSASIIEDIRILHRDLLQEPINPNIEGVVDRISAIENFHDPVFNSKESFQIKQDFINQAKLLEKRHKNPRPWMQTEYPEHCTIFTNSTDRLLATLSKNFRTPKEFNPYD